MIFLNLQIPLCTWAGRIQKFFKRGKPFLKISFCVSKEGFSPPPLYTPIPIYRLQTKDETWKTTVQSFYCLFSCIHTTGSRSTFEFPSRVYLSGPSLYCTGQDQPVQQGWRGQTLCFMMVEFTFTKGVDLRDSYLFCGQIIKYAIWRRHSMKMT